MDKNKELANFMFPDITETVEDLENVIRKYLSIDNAVISVLVPEEAK